MVPNFVQIGQGVAEIWPCLFFSRWRPSAILDLLYACLDHPRSVFWWSLSLCKIWFESVQYSFDNMQVLIFWALSLKMPIHAPFWGVFGQKWGKTETLCMFIPLRMQVTRKHAF